MLRYVCRKILLFELGCLFGTIQVRKRQEVDRPFYILKRSMLLGSVQNAIPRLNLAIRSHRAIQ